MENFLIFINVIKNINKLLKITFANKYAGRKMYERVFNRRFAHIKRMIENAMKASFIVLIMYLVHILVFLLYDYIIKSFNIEDLLFIPWLLSAIFILVLYTFIRAGFEEYEQDKKTALSVENKNIQKRIQILIKEEYHPAVFIYKLNFIIYLIMAIVPAILYMFGRFELHYFALGTLGIFTIILLYSIIKFKTLKIEEGLINNNVTIIKVKLKKKDKSLSKILRCKGKKVTVNICTNFIFTGYVGEIVIRSKFSDDEPILIKGDNIKNVKIGDKKFVFSIDEIEWIEQSEK